MWCLWPRKMTVFMPLTRTAIWEPNGGLLWQTNLGTAATSVLFGTRYYHNVLNPLLGITGTPVIDPVSGTLYVDVLTTPVPDTTNAQHHVHALNIANGAEQPYSPALVAASAREQEWTVQMAW